jgi:tryptophanyl-tRNA synthetase
MALNDPTRKMSKSIPGSFISLSDDEATIRKKIGRAVTDAGPNADEMSPGVKNLFTLLEECGTEEALRYFRDAYAAGALRYSELKPAVADAVVAALTPIRERRAELVAHPEQVHTALQAGAERATAVARRTMAEARQRLGLRRSP